MIIGSHASHPVFCGTPFDLLTYDYISSHDFDVLPSQQRILTIFNLKLSE